MMDAVTLVSANPAWWLLAISLMVAGVAGAILPVLPGTLLVLAGVFVGAWIDGFTRVMTTAIALETSAWEAGLCPVQRVDFRNFAHGRHVWAGRMPEKVLVLALTSSETRPMWAEIADRLPPGIRRLELDGWVSLLLKRGGAAARAGLD